MELYLKLEETQIFNQISEWKRSYSLYQFTFEVNCKKKLGSKFYNSPSNSIYTTASRAQILEQICRWKIFKEGQYFRFASKLVKRKLEILRSKIPDKKF